MFYLPVIVKIPGNSHIQAIFFTDNEMDAELIKIYLEKTYNTKVVIKNNFQVKFYEEES